MTADELQERIKAAEAKLREFVDRANVEIARRQGYIEALRELQTEMDKDNGRPKVS